MPIEIKQKLQQMGYEAEHLDSIVDLAATAQASRVNNEGMTEQLRYLEQQGYSENEIINLLEAAQ